MSLWLRTKDSRGRTHHVSVGFPWSLSSAGLGLAMALLIHTISMSVARAAILFLSLSVAGFLALAVAKRTVISRGRVVSFGAAHMTPAMRRLYGWGGRWYWPE